MPRFFGDFLIDSGEIDAGQLRQALDLCDRVNLRIGELAMREGWMNSRQVRNVLQEQRNVDERFGEIAVRLDYLSQKQLQALLHQRSTSHLYIGEALVELEHLARQDLERQLEQYKQEVAAFLRNDETPEEITGHRIAEKVVETFPRVASRMGRLQTLSRWGLGWSDDPRLVHRRWIAFENAEGFSIGIAASEELAKQIASAMLFTDPDRLSHEVLGDVLGDVLGEFLTLVVGSAVSAVGDHAALAKFGPPRDHGFPEQGHGLMLLTNCGPGCLVLRMPNAEAH